MFDHWIQSRIPASNAITLKQNQVYILPSRFGFLYLFFCLVLLLLAINFQNSLIYILCFWLSSLFVVTIIQTWLNLAGIHVRAGGSEPIFMTEQADFKLIVEGVNRSHHAIWLRTQQSITSVDVGKGTNGITSLFIKGERRGVLNLPRFKIETTYPLGIMRAWSYIDLDQYTHCYPTPIEAPLPQAQVEDFSDGVDSEHNTNVQGVENFEGLKNYQLGDSIRRISWHAYAKGQGLFVKEFTGQSLQEVWLDYEAFEGPLELRLSNLCYWVLRLSEEKKIFGLKLGMHEFSPATGNEHRNQCLQALSLFGN